MNPKNYCKADSDSSNPELEALDQALGLSRPSSKVIKKIKKK